MVEIKIGDNAVMHLKFEILKNFELQMGLKIDQDIFQQGDFD